MRMFAFSSTNQKMSAELKYKMSSVLPTYNIIYLMKKTGANHKMPSIKQIHIIVL